MPAKAAVSRAWEAWRAATSWSVEDSLILRPYVRLLDPVGERRLRQRTRRGVAAGLERAAHGVQGLLAAAGSPDADRHRQAVRESHRQGQDRCAGQRAGVTRSAGAVVAVDQVDRA